MKYDKNKKEIILDKEINNLDKFVFDFINLLNEYVIVSGYVSILLGRSRATEDIDLLIPKMNFESFKDIWKKFHENNFECINTSDVRDAFEMWNEHAIRFARFGKAIPNIEFKQITNDEHDYAFKNKIKVLIGGKIFLISPIEMQIAYKLYLGSQKDLEDAKHLYDAFSEELDNFELDKWIERFKVHKEFKIIK